MDMLQDIADRLAKDVMAFEAKAGKDRVAEEIAKTIGESSSTLEEAFMTSVRIRRAEIRGRTHLKTLMQKAVDDAKAGQ